MLCSLLPRDPDNVVLCLLATDEEDVKDVALQIHFTLIQAFCCENDINILRVNNMRRLAEILGGLKQGGEPMDLHCILVTVLTSCHFCHAYSVQAMVFHRLMHQHLFIVLLLCSNAGVIFQTCAEHVFTCLQQIVF